MGKNDNNITKSADNSIMTHITTEKSTNLYGLDAEQAWDTELAFRHLQGASLAGTKRTAERLIRQARLIAPDITPANITDEYDQPCKKIVLDWALQDARKKRYRILFLQLGRLPNNKPCLYANDPRGAHYWVPIASATSATLQQALYELQAHIDRVVATFATGQLLKYLRDMPASQHIKIYPQIYQAPIVQNYLNPRLGKLALPTSPHLQRLENESIHIIREAVAEAENPVMLYSIGKDSGVMLHLARKAFYPAPPPMPLLHVDTRWKFQEMYLFRDYMAKLSGMNLLVYTNPQAIEKNINPFDHGSSLHTDISKTEGLKQAIDKYKFDVIFGGARRDEEKSRAKERIFSFRTNSHQWDPKNQRPELWNLYNTRKNPGASIRVFPLSNWTELDIWQYIYQENIPVVPLYFAQERPVLMRDDMIMLIDDDRCRLMPDDVIQLKHVRFRTLGCYPLTGAVLSEAATIEEVLLEIINTHQSERQGRKIDSDSAGSMEKKKQQGYF